MRTVAAVPKNPDASPSPGFATRAAALAEVLLAFIVVHVTYRAFKHFTALGQEEVAAGLNFSAGATMILFTVLVLLVTRRNRCEYGLTLKDWPYNLNVGLFTGILTVLVGALIVRFALPHYDARRPPDMTRALIFFVAESAGVFVLLWLLARERRWLRRIPAILSLALLACLLLAPPAVAAYTSHPLGNVLMSVLWLFFGAGFGEEIFFRGYIQSRLNQAFGRPFRLLGVQFGLGLLVSSALFGFIHVLNTVDYFTGRWDFTWWWLPAFASGLFYGCLREKTGSVLAGGVHHGLVDVMAQVAGMMG